ncbi:MAG: hypothetical protein ACN6O3_15310 [Comamonas sp.]
MHKTITTALRLGPIVAALAAGAAFAQSGTAMSRADHQAANGRIEADYKAAKEQCKPQTGNAKDVCEKVAKGQESVAKAELEAQYKPGPRADEKVRMARADAEYAVAKEKCDDLSGNSKDVCQKDAKAAHVKAVEAAKVQRAATEPAARKDAQVQGAKEQAATRTREAEYKAAQERCDTLSGDAKVACVAKAKMDFGQ